MCLCPGRAVGNVRSARRDRFVASAIDRAYDSRSTADSGCARGCLLRGGDGADGSKHIDNDSCYVAVRAISDSGSTRKDGAGVGRLDRAGKV